MRILAKILALLTLHDRYFPEIEWSENSWTHNAFRTYEMLFGRRVGIRPEMTVQAVSDENGLHVTYACHSWEAVFALTETYIRETLASLKFQPIRIYIPVLMTPQGFPMIASPYIFAIAHDVSANSGAQSNSSPWTYSHTCTGANLTFTANFRWWSNGGTQSVSSIVYNSVALTLIATQDNESPTNYKSSAYYLANPSTGANTFTLTFSAGTYGIVGTTSFSGTNTASAIGASTVAHNFTPVNSFSNSLTTTFNNSFVMDIFGTSGGALASLANSQTTNFANGVSPACAGSSRIQKVTAGAQAMAWSWTATDQYGQVIYEVREAVASGPAGVKTWDGVTQSTGVKTYFALALASTKSVMGIT